MKRCLKLSPSIVVFESRLRQISGLPYSPSTSSCTAVRESSYSARSPPPAAWSNFSERLPRVLSVFSRHTARKAVWRTNFSDQASLGPPVTVALVSYCLVTESKGRDIRRLLLSLLAVATAAAICVAVIDSGGLLYRYGGGRIRSVGFSWVLQIVLLKLEIDPFPHLPAIVSQYSELRSWQQLAQFLVTAMALNVGLTWMVAAIVSPLYLLFARSRSVLLGLWLLFLSPAVLHLFCEVSIVGLGLQEFKTRILLAICFVFML